MMWFSFMAHSQFALDLGSFDEQCSADSATIYKNGFISLSNGTLIISLGMLARYLFIFPKWV